MKPISRRLHAAGHTKRNQSTQTGSEGLHIARTDASHPDAELQALREELKRYEAREQELIAAKEEAERLALAKGEFLASMSHELRSPMTAVMGMTDLLMRTPLTPEQRQMLKTLQSGGHSLLTIVNNILDSSKIEADRLELESRPYDPRQCVEECLDLVAAQAASKRIELAYEVDAETPRVLRGDPDRIRQILMNLLSNALKFTEAGEIVVVVTSREKEGNRTELQFSVKDTGIGIPGERVEKLFERYAQADASTARKFGGTGLGLHISLGLAQMMGGTMWVDSQSGHGSTFYFTVTSQTEAGPEPRRDERLAGIRVLLVDDSAAVLRMLRRQVESWGMTVASAISPEAALERLDSGERFDVAVVDRHLGDHDGLSFAADVRHRRANLPIVLMTSITASANSPALEAGDRQRAQFAAYVSRPVKPTRLFEALLKAVSSGPRAAEPAPKVETQSASAEQASDRNSTDPFLTTVLLVDNDPTLRDGVAQILVRKGFGVTTVGNGADAIQSIKAKRFDIVMLADEMPEMDGPATAARIHAELPADQQPYLIAVTDTTCPTRSEAWSVHGANHYLQKSYKVADLNIAMDHALAAVLSKGRPSAAA